MENDRQNTHFVPNNLQTLCNRTMEKRNYNIRNEN